MEHPRQRGALGEEIAAEHLRSRGWKILDRNYRDGPREVDLVVRRGEVLAFVEVKSRTGEGWGSPLEAITPRKRREVEGAARSWLRRHRPGAPIVRFDAVAVLWGRGCPPDVEHVPDAWWPGDR